MIFKAKNKRRRGSVLPLVALCLVALVGLLALAIDVGMISIARSQCQNAADAGAMAGARTITGTVVAGNTSTSYNAIPSNAVSAATANKVLSQAVQGNPVSVPSIGSTDSSGVYYTFQTGQVTVGVGTYAYVYNDQTPSSEAFQTQIPRTDTTEPYSAVQVTVTGSGSFSFARVFGLKTFNTSAQAVAVHRPRDVVIVLDLSGSMRFQSLPGIPLTTSDNWGNTGTFGSASSSSTPRVVSMNPDTVIPTFGHYSDTAGAALIGTQSYQNASGEMVDLCNISSDQTSGTAIVKDFYSNAVGTVPSAANQAFTSAGTSGSSAPVSGDNYLAKNGTSGTPPATYGSTAQEITNGKTFQGYQATPYTGYSGGTVSAFKGYTQGPGYWGKTFFIWPPDPRGSTLACTAANYANNGAKDWRQRFFIKVNTANGNMSWLDQNSVLFARTGVPATQGNPHPATHVINIPYGTSGGTSEDVTENGVTVTYKYRINYAAILYWLFDASQTPNPFPTTLTGGRIRYYSSVPNYNDTTLNSRWWAADTGITSSGNALSDLNERFWKDYIDFVLGTQTVSTGQYDNEQSNCPFSAFIGNGDYYQWGKPFQISDRPDPPSVSTPYQTGTASVAYASGYNSSLVVNAMTDTVLVGDILTFGSNTTNQYTVASITGPVSGVATITLNRALVASVSSGATVKFYPYMDYNDNPYRPRHQFWFGPMTMVDYLGNYQLTTGWYGGSLHWWPGNCHEAHSWACKAGIQSAIADIKSNHPNDFVALSFFSTPKYSAGGTGHHNRSVIPLGRNYQQLIDSLWFPPSTVTGGATEITPYNSDMPECPRADGGTSVGMGFMLAYNQLSNSATNLRFYAQPSYKLPSASTPNYRGDAGGLGRKGAYRLVIFETDGFPNTRAVSSKSSSGVAGLSGTGSDSYFPIRIGNPVNVSDSTKNTEWPSSGTYADSEVFTIVKQICALDSASAPGFSTSSRPAKIYCIGYGSIFDPSNPSSAQTDALTFLQSVQYYGGTSADTTASHFPVTQQIYGTAAQRITRMQTTFTNIMQSGVQVSLIK